MKTKKVFNRQEIANMIGFYLQQQGYDPTQCLFTMEERDIHAEVDIEDIKSSLITHHSSTTDESVIVGKGTFRDLVLFFLIMILAALAVIGFFVEKISDDIKEIRSRNIQQMSARP